MLTVLLLLAIAVPQQGKVVVQTGVAGAEFYLDGTLVSRTDQKGTLSMESFPAGSFKYAVRKDGYQTYEGAFTLGEGESKVLEVSLVRLKAAQPLAEPGGPSGEKRRRAESRPPSPTFVPTAAKPAATPTHEPLRPSPPQPATSDSEAPSAWLWVTMAALALAGARYWFRTRGESPHQEPEAAPAAEEKTAAESDRTPKPAPEFIDELRRREELMNAGFIGNKKRSIDSDKVGQREKEIVIVLPKDAYNVKDTE